MTTQDVAFSELNLMDEQRILVLVVVPQTKIISEKANKKGVRGKRKIGYWHWEEEDYLDNNCRYAHLWYFWKKGKKERKNAQMAFIYESKIAHLFCKIKHMAAKLREKYVSFLSPVFHSHRNWQVLISDHLTLA